MSKLNKSPNIMIVEDQAVLAYDLLDRLKEYGFNQLMGPFKSGEKALIACNEMMPNIAILDIRLAGEMNGIQLAKELNLISEVFIIYLTQQEDEKTFNASVETDHIAFINKPFTNNEIRSALLRAVKQLDLEQTVKPKSKKVEKQSEIKGNLKIFNDRIYLRSAGKKIRILLDDIILITSNKGQGGAEFIVKNKEEHQNKKYVTSHGLNVLEKKLSFYPFLVRVSRFNTVNLKYLKLIDDADHIENSLKTLDLEQYKVKVGDKYRKQVMDKLPII
ncbi:MAG: response regulator [Bacteroidota bacterium]